MAPDRRLVLLLAARADCNVKTARRALAEGVDTIKGANLRDRLRAGIDALAPLAGDATKVAEACQGIGPANPRSSNGREAFVSGDLPKVSR